MASFSRGQLPARHTKVVDENQRPLKTGSPGCGSLRNDGTSSKPYCKGRDVAEDSQGGACIECCGSKRCKTCDHIFVGSTFSSNVGGRWSKSSVGEMRSLIYIRAPIPVPSLTLLNR